MKKFILSFLLLVVFSNIMFSQDTLKIEGRVVFSNDDVVFHQIDEHTWVGSGHQMWHESLYLVEGSDRAVLIDAGTNIQDLDKIVASIARKPVMLVATHVHPDHTGPSINCFPQVYINPGDTNQIPEFMGNYKGVVKYLKDREIIYLGNRQLEVVFTPGHTKGSTTFIDKNAGYGFSGDSFGTGLLLLGVDFSTFIATCKKMCSIMEEYDIRYLYPGHYNDSNMETLRKIKDMLALSQHVLSGEIKGVANPDNTFGLNFSVDGNRYRIIYNESAIK
ncbi:MAG: MBL fold metallo-hydrolase [Bacteroidales bacterium]|nr:MBL fold metallo-hydrolase [Bacteroidales bacterium]MDD3521709.1 MBL fold metallo-hydrolase [Bacteroidales bacterium]MDD4030990.1 MBL fold metallo-hydrolase [Bacteroidales bacterium]MDD4435735.1 MBL fold metallo-hydrolase [Bacteroidales bacterium]